MDARRHAGYATQCLPRLSRRNGAPAQRLSAANLLHQAFFDEAARPARATDPLPASPSDIAELQRTLALAPKYNTFFAPRRAQNMAR